MVNEEKWSDVSDIEKENAYLRDELHQQRFNNKHNFSIDQKVSDEIASLKAELEELNVYGFRNLKAANENIRKENNLMFCMLEKRDKLLEEANDVISVLQENDDTWTKRNMEWQRRYEDLK